MKVWRKHFSTLSQPNTCVRTEAGAAKERVELGVRKALRTHWEEAERLQPGV